MADSSEYFGGDTPVPQSVGSGTIPGAYTPGAVYNMTSGTPIAAGAIGTTSTATAETTAATAVGATSSADNAVTTNTVSYPQRQTAGKFEDNILGNYANPAYHIRFYTRGARIAGGNPIVIAESGVTGYNIKELTMTTMAAPTETHKNVYGMECRMVVTEPLGTSFLDAMLTAAGQSGAENWTAIPYLIEISFKGYDEDGKPNPNLCKSYPNGGVWTYEIRISNLDVHIDATGGTYTISGILFHNIALDNKANLTLETIHIAKAQNLGEFFQDLAKQLTATSAKREGAGKYTYKFDLQSAGSGGSPSSFKFSNAGEDKKDPYRMRSFAQDSRDAQGANIGPGVRINDIIMAAFANSVEGQKMALSTDGRLPPDDLGDGKYRESGMFRVYPMVQLGRYFPDTQSYGLDITYVVKMYRSTNTILRGDETTRPGNSQQAIAMLQQRAGILKRYEYIFTGLNTEVLELDIKYNLVWSALVPQMKGYNYYTEGYAASAEYNPVPRTPADQVKKDLAEEASGGNGRASQAQTGTNNLANSQTSTAPGTVQPNSVVYVENLLTRDRADNPLPISVGQENNTARRTSGTGLSTGWQRGKSVFGTLMDQTATTVSMNTVSMTIKGDPFWLGQGYDAMVRGQQTPPAQTQPSNATTLTGGSLPSFASGDNCFALYFRYPFNWGETGNYVFRDNDVYNGVYIVKTVEHTFSGGVFKQKLDAIRLAVVTPDDAIKMAGSLGEGAATPAATTPPAATPPAATPPATTPGTSTTPSASTGVSGATNPNSTGSTGA